MTALRAFVAREGHARVPRPRRGGDRRLGTWVMKRRTERDAGQLDPARAAELEALPGWTWDPFAEDWAAAMTALRTYAAREGNARVPSTHREGDLHLGRWVVKRRAERNAGRLAAARIAELEALPGWSWGRAGASPTSIRRRIPDDSTSGPPG